METKRALHNHMELCMSPSTSPCSGDDLKMLIARRDGEIQHLREEVRRLQRLLQEVQERTANHVTLLQQQLTNKSRDVEILQARLQSQQDYVKIKAELSSLQPLNRSADKPVSSPAPDVCDMSVKQSAALYSQPTGDNGPAVLPEVKTPVEFHQDSWSEPSADISDLSADNKRSSSMILQTTVKEETSASCMYSISDEDDVNNTDSDEVMDQDEGQLDTARITQQVKEFLQMHNIGQRVFGHCVLGLSQGTVSDILARPKPWSKLTVRGREPFIRMKNFLANEHNIQTLCVFVDGRTVEENDRRSPGVEDPSDKIRKILEQAKHEMHLSSVTTSEICTTQRENSPLKPNEVHSERLDPSDESPTDFVQSIIQKVQREISRNPYTSVSPSHSWSPPPGQGSFQTLPVDSEPELYNKTIPAQKRPREEGLIPQPCRLDRLAVESCRKNQQLAQDQSAGLTLDCPAGINNGLDCQQFQSLELDTFSITKRVKDILTVNNLGQRLFGETVLGLTQSSVSELLSHPKPWTKLSVRGKENFIRMNLWLQDPRNVQKLNTIKMMDQRARLKRALIGSDFDLHGTIFDTSDNEFSLHDHSELFNVSKRPRVVLSYWEKEALKTAYQKEPYPSQHTIETLASQLNLKITTVSNWFYNYRSRSRQDTCHETASLNESEHTIQSPTGLSSVSDSSLTGLTTSLLSFKQETDDAEIKEETELRNHCVSIGVQSDRKVKREDDDDDDDGQLSPASSL
ncbi:Homeobox protein cut-like 1 CCAAT displacement protein [Triplophysa tibetana]|uniref:DNA-binding protein SATB n=1 Tax=Triplophysa tibetana TaxID=1572043 RepID=A0A5A9P8S6_9TELE|nr:Homeobox protein cut-like 1 CCAAT displacement protein [Triplophysa tibetana]